MAYQNDGTRPDDSVAAIEKRIELFHQVTQPVIDYYKHKDMLVEVDGEQTIEVIHEQILRALGK